MNNVLKKLFKRDTKDFGFIAVIFFTIILRLVNLGYSDYQGDEIKAFFNPDPGMSVSEFLLDQRKGPMQFIVSFMVKLINNSYSNEFLTRLPFAVAGILSIYFFYKLVEIHFSRKIAFYSSFFLTTNGFFIAFSRIAQYQSLVILFGILSLYLLSLAVKVKSFSERGIYLGLISWSFSILSHYDGVFFAPFAFWLLYKWFKDNNLKNRMKAKVFLSAGIISTVLILIFYIPFIFTISDATRDYWSGRITGNVSSKIASSKYLFTVYQPIYIVHIYIILFLSGTVSYFTLIACRLGINYKGAHKQIKLLSEKLNKFLKDVFNRNDVGVFGVVLLWFAIPAFFMEKLVYISGTHVYTYLIPAMIILAFGINIIEKFVYLLFKGDYGKVLRYTGIFMIFSFIFIQQYMVFVDNSTEYPWENEKFLLWTFPKPSPIYHLSMFGFPYYRNWEGIKQFTQQYLDITAYSTNERKSIVRFYVPLEKSSDLAGFYIYIDDPQSFTNEIINKKPEYWVSKYDPVYTLEKGAETLARVYIMPTGTLDEIIIQGF